MGLSPFTLAISDNSQSSVYKVACYKSYLRSYKNVSRIKTNTHCIQTNDIVLNVKPHRKSVRPNCFYRGSIILITTYSSAHS